MRAPLIIITAVILLAVLFEWLASAAEAQSEDRMREHIEWITAHSDLEYHGEPLPLVLPESQRGLHLMFYGAQAVIDAEASDSTVLGELNAVFNHDDDVIFYRDDIPGKKFDLMLVHELVHYLQDLNGIMDKVRCLAETERQAYDIQERWQDAHDDPNDRPDGFTVMVLSMCADERY